MSSVLVGSPQRNPPTDRALETQTLGGPLIGCRPLPLERRGFDFLQNNAVGLHSVQGQSRSSGPSRDQRSRHSSFHSDLPGRASSIHSPRLGRFLSLPALPLPAEDRGETTTVNRRPLLLLPLYCWFAFFPLLFSFQGCLLGASPTCLALRCRYGALSESTGFLICPDIPRQPARGLLCDRFPRPTAALP